MTGAGVGPRRVRRPGLVTAIAALLVVWVCTSDRRQVGDSGEYVAMSINMSLGRPAALSTTDVTAVKERFAAWDLSFPVVFPQ